MNSYGKKQEEKRARFEHRAEGAANEATAAHQRAHQMAEAIPFGQPILVGHHSEGGDRRYRARIHDTFGKSVALQDKAEHYRNKAAAVGTRGISSDDPDAIAKLRGQLVQVRADQENMVKANKAVRRNDAAALVEMGYATEDAAKLLQGDFAGRKGYPSYALQNNSANARRIEQRIKLLEKRQDLTSAEQTGKGYTYREDVEENRVMFIFDGKPEVEKRAVLKSHAFKWSPSRDAWVRLLTGNAQYAGRCVREALDKLG